MDKAPVIKERRSYAFICEICKKPGISLYAPNQVVHGGACKIERDSLLRKRRKLRRKEAVKGKGAVS